MSRSSRLLSAIALVIAALLPGAPAARAAETLERIVAVVNQDVVLASELEAEMAFVRDQMQRSNQRIPPNDVLRERILERLVLERIQLQRAERGGITVDDEAVNNALRNMAERNNTDLAGMRRKLAEDGIDFNRLRQDIRRQLVVSRLRQREVASQVQVSEQAIDDALQRMEQASREQTEFRLSHILIGVSSEATSGEVREARERARSMVERLRADGADFSNLATRVSDGPEALSGGQLGWRSAASLPGLFVEAVRGMDAGEVSDPLRSPNGFHILRLEDRRGGVPQTVTEIRARHILIKGEGDGETSTQRSPRQRLEVLRREIRSGADFAELARTHSDDQASAPEGGSLGWVGPGEMTPAFQQVIESLEPGRLSEPFRTPYGWHLAQVLETRERRDVEQYRRSQVRRALYERELEQKAQRWRQRLRDQAYVEIRDRG